jgi:hypothetical protein
MLNRNRLIIVKQTLRKKGVEINQNFELNNQNIEDFFEMEEYILSNQPIKKKINIFSYLLNFFRRKKN